MRTLVKLKDIASYSKGSQINADDLIDDGTYDYLNGGVNPSGKWSDFNVCGNTIAISEGGNSCGYVNYMKKPFWCGAHCYYLFDLKCTSKYLYYALKGHQNDIMSLRSGACMPNIKKKDLGEFSFLFDTNETEQKKIIKIFDGLSDIITHRKQQLSKLDELVKARFVEMFGNGNYPNVCIGEVLIQNTTVEKIIDTKTEKYVTVGIRGTGARERIIKDGKYPVPFSGYRVKSGQFIYSRIDARNGAFALLSDDLNNAVVSKDFPVFDINQNKIIPFMLLFSVLQDSFVKQIQNSSFGATNRQRIKEEVFSKYKIALPPLELQNQFAAFVSQVDKSKFIAYKHLRISLEHPFFLPLVPVSYHYPRSVYKLLLCFRQSQ